MSDVATSQQLKGLQVLLAKAQGELRVLKEECAQKQREVSACARRVNELQEKVIALSDSDKGIIVTEHAILRYLERVYKLDLDELRRRIVSDAVEAQIRICGNGRYPVGSTHMIVVKNNAVTTVLAGEE